MLYLEKEYLAHNFDWSMYYTDKKGPFLCKKYTLLLQASTIMAIFIVRNYKNLASWASNSYRSPGCHTLNEW